MALLRKLHLIVTAGVAPMLMDAGRTTRLAPSSRALKPDVHEAWVVVLSHLATVSSIARWALKPVISPAVSWTFVELGGLLGVVKCFWVCPNGRPGSWHTGERGPAEMRKPRPVGREPSTGHARQSSTEHARQSPTGHARRSPATPLAGRGSRRLAHHPLASYALTTWNWRPGAYGVPPGV